MIVCVPQRLQVVNFHSLYMCCMFTTVAEITEMLQHLCYSGEGVSGKPFFAFMVEVHTAGLAFRLSATCGLLLSAQYTQ